MRTHFQICQVIALMGGVLLGLVASETTAASSYQSGVVSGQEKRMGLIRETALDLTVIRNLEQRVQRGEITDSERQHLWQAYLARVSAPACIERDKTEGQPNHPAHLFPTFVGPGF